MNNPFEYVPDAACREAFVTLSGIIEAARASDRPEDVDFCREIDAGKMLGVLVAEDECGGRRTLFAFSGQLGDRGFHYPGFVGPVFDYLQPDGYFRKREDEISRLNDEISRMESDELAVAQSRHDRTRAAADAELAECKERYRLSKIDRDARRQSGEADADELEAMIRQSQFEKAELRRLKKRLTESLEPMALALGEVRSRLEALKQKRHADSEALQRWLFSSFKVLNARGESRSLSEIFAGTALGTPPSGAGECCAPKLLQEAFRRGLRPLSIAEYWHGKGKSGEVRIHGHHYPACRGKCLPILQWMLQGLPVDPPLEQEPAEAFFGEPDIVYENEWFCVVDKPSGMLSVPGKGGRISLQDWLEQRYGDGRFVKMAHRLDQDTSGLIVAACSPLAFKVMQTMFATRKVKKTYVADLEGDYRQIGIPPAGRIELPLSPDWLDRPRQRVDQENGKEAVTEYEFTSVSSGRSRVTFRPLTGRTHQLRVHAASSLGLGMPMAGDRLYGSRSAGRLHLHAHRLEFTFPIDRQPYIFTSDVPF